MHSYDNFGCCLSSVILSILEGVLFFRNDFLFLFNNPSVGNFC